MKTGILLVNLGTPNSYKKKDVARYLTEFLTDKRVIDLPFIKRQFLVRSLIVPFRSKLSSQSYQQIWNARGSPLMFHTEDLAKKLQALLGSDVIVTFAMRYQNPSLENTLNSLKESGLKELIIVPLFPQYASATSGSIFEKVMHSMQGWQTFPHLKFISSFYNHPLFINAFCEKARQDRYEDYDHLLISFHGLPENQLKKANPSVCLKTKNCCMAICNKNQSCYGAQCYQTAFAIAKNLGLSSDKYTVCFQSRLGKTPWIQPYTSDVIKDLRAKGVKKLLVMCPAFVADCLETIFEIEVEYKHEFISLGGSELKLIPGLNSDDAWTLALKEIIFPSQL